MVFQILQLFRFWWSGDHLGNSEIDKFSLIVLTKIFSSLFLPSHHLASIILTLRISLIEPGGGGVRL